MPAWLPVNLQCWAVKLLKNANTLSTFLHDEISHGSLFMFCRLAFLLKIIVQFVECWSDLWSYIYFLSTAHDSLAEWTGSLSDFCLLLDFHLALQSSVYSLFRCSFWFLFIIPLFSKVKSALRAKMLAEVNQTCEGPWGEIYVSVFLSLYVRESPLARTWRGELVRDYKSPEICSLITMIDSCLNQNTVWMVSRWPLFILEAQPKIQLLQIS